MTFTNNDLTTFKTPSNNAHQLIENSRVDTLSLMPSSSLWRTRLHLWRLALTWSVRRVTLLAVVSSLHKTNPQHSINKNCFYFHILYVHRTELYSFFYPISRYRVDCALIKTLVFWYTEYKQRKASLCRFSKKIRKHGRAWHAQAWQAWSGMDEHEFVWVIWDTFRRCFFLNHSI